MVRMLRAGAGGLGDRGGRPGADLTIGMPILLFRSRRDRRSRANHPPWVMPGGGALVTLASTSNIEGAVP